MWAPAADGAADAPRGGEGLASRPRSATPRRPVALHLAGTTGRSGATDAAARHGWLGRYLDRHGVADNPLQGLSLGGDALARAGDRATRSPRSTASTTTASGPRASATRSLAARCSPRSARSAAALRRPDRRRRARRSQPDGRPHPLAPFAAGDGQPGFPRPVDLPRAATFGRAAAPGSRRCSARDCRSGRSRSTRPAAYDTHADQAADARRRRLRDLRGRCWRSSATSRRAGMADRVLVPRLERVRPPARRRTTRGTDHGAAGIGFLIGSRGARARRSASSRAWRRSTASGNLRATSDFRGGLLRAARAVVRRRRRADHPARARRLPAAAARALLTP